MELAIINGTYRSASEQAAAVAQLAKQPLAAALRKQPPPLLLQANSEVAALAQAQARGMGTMLGAPIARSPTLAVAGAPIVMSPGRGQTATSTATSTAQMQQLLQSQLGAAAAAQQNAQHQLAAQQAAIIQQQQAEYQQILLR